MKLRWKITVLIALAGALVAFLLFSRGNSAQRAVEETRRALRLEGFKTDLSEFDFSTSDESRARIAALTNASPLRASGNPEDYARRSLREQILPNLMQAIERDSAIPVWKQDRLPADDGVTSYLRPKDLSGYDLWPLLHESFNEDRELLDAACAAALSGPIRFDLEASKGMHMLLPDLAPLKSLIQTLGCRTVLELRDGDKDAAWTNLLAATRLVTTYEPESIEICHLVRFACAAIAFYSTWQLLQSDVWSDERLGQLQREWESVDYLRGLPETAAFSRASAVAACQLERQQPVQWGVTFRDALRSPRDAWLNFRYYRRRLHYRHHGTYEDEKALLLHYRDRELEIRHAVKSPSWSGMSQLPGVTNALPFQSKHPSSLQAMLNTRKISLGFAGQRQGLLGRAAAAETLRRLIITAIALERYRTRRGSYPGTLEALVPEFLKHPPADFMDGQPLRYRLTADGHFVLYSVGLDCLDNGGEMRRPAQRGIRTEGIPDFGIPQGTDLVWPRPASAVEVESFQQERLKAQQDAANEDAELQAEEQWLSTARRQARVEQILATKPGVSRTEPKYRGQLLSELLRNENTLGTNKLTLNELLTLKQIVTGGEPETVTFEAPIRYESLTNLGELLLLIDPSLNENADECSDESYTVGWLECNRATNGNCRLVWSTIYESPGKHALQMVFELHEPEKDNEAFFVGPFAEFVVTNLCQFSLSSAHFLPEFGATLRAKLPEPNASYTVEIQSLEGERLRTISGNTSNGVVRVHWDLNDDRGRRSTNHAFNTSFDITLPDSGRSQKMKGP